MVVVIESVAVKVNKGKVWEVCKVGDIQKIIGVVLEGMVAEAKLNYLLDPSWSSLL